MVPVFTGEKIHILGGIMNKQTFVDLFQQSVIMQGSLSLLVVGLWGYLLATGQEVPAELSAVVTLVIGFFFGSKLSLVQAKPKE